MGVCGRQGMVALVCVVLVCIGVVSTRADVPTPEREALVDLFTDCGGASWKRKENWLQGDPCTNLWYGVNCTQDNAHIRRLVLNPIGAFNVLSGRLPDSLGNLTYLEEIFTSNAVTPSHLEGPIPTTLASLHNLRCFYVSHNLLSGTIPSFFARMSHMEGLFFRYNQFSGSLPDFGGLSNLTRLWTDLNQLSGNVTWLETAHLPLLHTLQLSWNRFTGPLPSAACGVHSCEAKGNQFQCPLPPPSPCCGVTHCEAAASHEGAWVSPRALQAVRARVPPGLWQHWLQLARQTDHSEAYRGRDLLPAPYRVYLHAQEWLQQADKECNNG